MRMIREMPVLNTELIIGNMNCLEIDDVLERGRAKKISKEE